MKRVLPLLTAFLLLVPASSGLNLYGQTGEARSLLDRVAQAFVDGGGVKAEFRVDGGASGSIYLSGERFVIETGSMKTWFDGSTQWTYLNSSDEVNISNPTPEELQTLNPYAWLSLYKQGYSLSLSQTTDSRGRTLSVVTMNKTDKSPGPATVSVTVNTANYRLQRVELTMQSGTSPIVIDISSYADGLSLADDYFVFPRAKYPTAEVIDLR